LVEASAADVTFLVRPGRKAQIDKDGLRIESMFGNATLQVNAVTAPEPAGSYDLVLLTSKAYDLESAIAAIKPAVGPNTAVLPLLNGLNHLEILNNTFGKANVLGGMAAIHIAMLPDGLLKHFNDWRSVNFGEQDGTLSERVLALKAAFDKCGEKVIATAAADVLQKMWDKLVLLSTLAGMTCLMRANIGEIVRAPGGKEIGLTMLERNGAIAAAAGFGPAEKLMANYRKIFSDPDNDFTASMLRDLERKGPVEADHIVGFMLAKARQFGIEPTLHQVAYTHLKAYEERRKAGRA
jgi:2-dehydropantoate 2-reductase